MFFFSAWGYLVKTPELQTVGATSEFPYGGSCRQQTHVGDVRYDELVVISLCEVFVDCYWETSESGACQDIDTRGTGSLTRAGASRVIGVIEEVNHVTKFLSRVRLSVRKWLLLHVYNQIYRAEILNNCNFTFFELSKFNIWVIFEQEFYWSK